MEAVRGIGRARGAGVARVAFFTGYASALADAERYEESQAVMDALGERKCG